jgi:hypothetical protein
MLIDRGRSITLPGPSKIAVGKFNRRWLAFRHNHNVPHLVFPSTAGLKLMPVFLSGLAVQFFRGIGPEVQELGPFREFNFFVGANNSGKSTILDLIHRHIAPSHFELEKIDTYSGAKTGTFNFEIGLPKGAFKNAVLTEIEARARSRGNILVSDPIRSAALAICESLARSLFSCSALLAKGSGRKARQKT